MEMENQNIQEVTETTDSFMEGLDEPETVEQADEASETTPAQGPDAAAAEENLTAGCCGVRGKGSGFFDLSENLRFIPSPSFFIFLLPLLFPFPSLHLLGVIPEQASRLIV